MHGLVERAGPVAVRVERVALCVRLGREEVGAVRLALVDFAGQRLQRLLVVVVLGTGAGRGRNEAPGAEGGARTRGKDEAGLQPENQACS